MRFCLPSKEHCETDDATDEFEKTKSCPPWPLPSVIVLLANLVSSVIPCSVKLAVPGWGL